jgi:integrase
MDLLNDMKNWLNSEFPSQDEIKDTINRLGVNASANPIDKRECQEVIKLLKAELTGNSFNEEGNISNSSKGGLAAFPSDVAGAVKKIKVDLSKIKGVKAAGSRAASPIKDKGDIKAIAKMMVKWGYVREAHMLIIGCNTALRYSDLRMIRFDQIIYSPNQDDTGYIEQIVEQKTKKLKRLTLNKTAMNFINLRYECLQKEGVESPVYVFQGTGNRTKKTPSPVSRSHVNYVLKYVRESMGLDFQLSTHSMRKSFGYHAYNNGKGLDILVLRKLFNHASEEETMKYIGVDAQRVQEAYIDAEIEISL